MALVFEILEKDENDQVVHISLYPKYVQTIKYGDELIWSPNTRRNASAKMTGRIIGDKYKLEVSYTCALPQANLRAIRNKAMSKKEWHKIRFTDETGEVVEKIMYFGGYSVEPHLFVNGTMIYQSISISLIER